ncbi:MAG: acyltransferase family protein [Janthinobacterium lividum]
MNKAEITALTGLRGLAAILIVVHHMFLLMLPMRGHWLAPAFAKFGLLGMSIFFVLSGFVIHYNYAAKIASGGRRMLDFMVSRFARLYPLYLIFVLGNFAFNYTIYPSYQMFLPYNVLGIQSWMYKVVEGVNITESQTYANNAWSISTEMMLYLLFIPLAFFGRFKTPTLRRGVALFLAAIIGRLLVVHYAGDIGHALSKRFGETANMPPDQWLIYFSPYGRFFEFLAGAALAEIWMVGPLTVKMRRTMGVLGCLGFAYIVASFFDNISFSEPYWFEGDHLHIGYAIAVPLTVFGLCMGRNLLSSFVAMAVGEASYSIYLLHSDLFPLYQLGQDSTLTQRVVNAASFLAVLGIASWATHRYVEMPAKRLITNAYRRAKSCGMAKPA